MFDKLDFIHDKYDELNRKIADPEVINNQPEWQKYMKELSDIEPIVHEYKRYKEIKEGLESTKSILEESTDEELREIAKMEPNELEESMAQSEHQLKLLLLPKDPNDEKNVIVEIRAGAGGDEAGLFAGDLLRMIYAIRGKAALESRNDECQ